MARWTVPTLLGSACLMGCNGSAQPSATSGIVDASVDGQASGGGQDTGAGVQDASEDATMMKSGNVSDGAPSDAPVSDATPTDAGDGGDGAAGSGCDGGTGSYLLEPGATLSVGGVTSDGYVLYYDSSTQTYYATSLCAGGAVTTLYSAPGSTSAGYFAAAGNVAYLWSWNSNFIGTLTAWTSAMAQGAPLTTSGLAYLYQTVWVTDDSKHVVFLVQTDAGAAEGSLYAANPDGTDMTLLLSDIDIDTSFSVSMCFPRVVTRGDSVVVSYCAAGDDASVTPTLESFSISNGWAPGAVVTNWIDSLQFNLLDRSPFTFPFAVDPDGGRIAAASSTSGNGSLQVFPVDGGPSMLVASNVMLAPTLSFTGSVANPWSILYNDDAGDLWQAYASNPAPQLLVDSGVNFFNALSNDGQWMLTSNQSGGGWFQDLSLVSVQTPGVFVPFVSSAQYGDLPVAASGSETGGNRGFTADSAYALAVTNMTQALSGAWIGYLRSMSVTSPYTTSLLTNGYMAAYQMLTGSKVLVADNFQDSDGASNPTVDFDLVDPASSASPINLARGVPGNAAITADGTHLVYLVTEGSAPGLYVVSLP